MVLGHGSDQSRINICPQVAYALVKWPERGAACAVEEATSLKAVALHNGVLIGTAKSTGWGPLHAAQRGPEQRGSRRAEGVKVQQQVSRRGTACLLPGVEGN